MWEVGLWTQISCTSRSKVVVDNGHPNSLQYSDKRLGHLSYTNLKGPGFDMILILAM